MLIKILRGWEMPEREATPEEFYLSRRQFIKKVGWRGMSTALALAGWGGAKAVSRREDKKIYPAKRNEKFALDRPLTDEWATAHYNNFYEFTTAKERVADLVGKFQTSPWTVEITGLVAKPLRFDSEDLIRRMPLEERLYRHRCVEAWSMAVPWTGFPMKALVELAQPLSTAKFVRLLSFNKPEQAPGIKSQSWYSWPYYEGLRMDEAINELTMLVTGIYGHALPKQNGAPLRLVTPWKYGYKSIKSITKIEFVDKQPHTFWNDLAPAEYDFLSNVNPQVPHPRWSQATEQPIPDGPRRPTLRYNGYGAQVAALYKA